MSTRTGDALSQVIDRALGTSAGDARRVRLNGRDSPLAPQAYVGGISHSSFDHANRSDTRGDIWFADLETSRELDSASREELMRRGRWSDLNIAPYTAVLDNVPTMITGPTGLRPFPTTTDKDWNREALQRYMKICGARDSFDLAGRWNVFEAQTFGLRSQYRDGDLLGIYARDGDSSPVMMQFYEGHQCRSRQDGVGFNAARNSRWLDGVQLDRHHRAVRYRIESRNRKSASTFDRAQVSHFVDTKRRGYVRGVPVGHNWFNDGQDWLETRTFFKSSIKNSARQAWFRYRTGSTATPTDPSFAAPDRLNVGDEESPDNVPVEDFDPAHGSETRYLGADKLEILHDQRPHPNVVAMQESLISGLATGIGLPPHLLFYIAGMGGTETRQHMVIPQLWLKARQQQLINTFVSPHYIRFIAGEMARGTLRPCADPDWEKHGVICPKDMTVDVGREGALKIKLYKERMLTLQAWCGELGVWWEDYQDTTIREPARGARRLREIAKEEGVTPEEIIAYQQHRLASDFDPTATD